MSLIKQHIDNCMSCIKTFSNKVEFRKEEFAQFGL